jgi:transcriptional regulator with XRE-family HTH domain
MGRGERPLDPEAGAVEKFAYELRQLRQQAGAPTYRTLAQRTHYSVTALSQAAAGHTLPSLAVLRAFVQACDGDVEAWEERWRETVCAATPAGGARDDAVCEVPKLSASQGVEPEPTGGAQSRPLEISAQPPPRRGWRHLRRRPRAVVLAAVIVVVAAVTAGMLWPATPSRGRGVGAVDPIADGSDPNRAGCGPGAVTLATANVHFPSSQLSGQVELRYSPRCHAAWGRFEPASGWNPGPGTMVTVWTIRPADQATQSYTVEFGGEAIIGNMLMTARGCVAAEVSMNRGQAASPVATTLCLTVN